MGKNRYGGNKIRMKRKITIVLIGILPFLLGACSNGEQLASSQEGVVFELEESLAKKNELKHTKETEEQKSEESELSIANYPKEFIEYARVWASLAPNQKIDALQVRLIEEGEPLHAHVESSANYPEDVIQLTGTRLMDGSITYSGNGDGTINVYHVPLSFEATIPKNFDEEAMKVYTESIIANTELVPIDEGDEEEILSIIEKIEDREPKSSNEVERNKF